ncbi:hypothetical protein L4B78_03825 [Vibrio anguillarum]|uniref:hypothetical protein n=1 Tax=Vibrio anguillarum TaxID=55601 RepID=UPI003D0A33DD
MIIRDVKFMRIDAVSKSELCAIIKTGITQDSLQFVGAFWFDDCFMHHLTGSAIFTRKGEIVFSSDASLHDLYLQFRKQDEAPEMGADSSIKLCDGCKNTFASNQEECPDCKQYANVAPIRGVK